MSISKKEDILSLRKQGYSYREIQNIVGCSRGTISYHCNKDSKKNTLKRQKQVREDIRKYIREYKTENNICTDCQKRYQYWILDFDHLSNKKFTISKFSNITADINKVIEEIKKCEIVCANCHRTRSHQRQFPEQFDK